VAVVGSVTPARRVFAELLAEARARTLLLVSTLSGEQMARPPRAGVPSVLQALRSIVDFEQSMLLDEAVESRSETYDEWFDRMMDVRERALQLLGGMDAPSEDFRAFERHRIVLEHEYRMNEAILEALQCQGESYQVPHHRRLPLGRGIADPGFMVRFAGGVVEVGGDEDDAVWPEERPAHAVKLEPFWIDAIPVTNADYMTFIAADGYTRKELWSREGWDWLQASQYDMPENWSRAKGTWRCRWLGRETPLDPALPVSHVSFYEAEAFATFVGKRLPTELEWETAASWDPELQTRRKYPWGNMPPSTHVANLDQFALAPAAVGAFPGNFSPLGCYGMIGDLWEWTSSRFEPYPGAAAGDNPVILEAPVILSEAKDLSTVATEFDSSKRVLRGGSWATRPGAIRVSVRRPAPPGARHLFTGFRCARDA
jgi:gamma-glutamyl hercynylcysteine S-oxide synthase